MLAGDQRRHSPQNKNGIWIRKSQPSQPNATTPFEMTDSNNLLITKGLVLSVDYVHTGSTKTVYAGVWADKALRLVKTPAGTTTGEVIAQSK